MTTLTPYVTTKYYQRLCEICVSRYGSSENDVVVYVLDKNPGLESQGIVLDPGLIILLPDLPKGTQTQVVRKQTFLWS